MTTTPNLTELVASPCYPQARRRVVFQLVASLCFEGLLPVPWRGHGTMLAAEFKANGTAYLLRARRRTTFGRLTLGALERGEGGEPGPAEFLHDVSGLVAAPSEHVTRFAEELERTVLNDALARQHGTGETEAHPYHPSFKSRVGFDIADNLAFGPEFGVTVAPRWLAIDARFAAAAPSKRIELAGFVAAELAEDLPRFEAHLRERGRTLDDIVLVPVHPWQWREQLAYRLAPMLAAETVTDLGPAATSYRPRTSIRTLANTDQPDRCDLKLALGIMNTSAERTLASHTVRNAAPISDWLHDLVTADPALNGLVVRREVLGISAGALHGHLAAIWRESLAPQLTSGEAAVSFTRLATSGAPSDPTLRARLIRDGAAVWVRQLLEVTLVPLVHLLVRHGIGVEAHAQNLLLIHERGWPARLAIHDLHDGIRFARHHLAAPEAAPPLVATPEAHLAANRNSYVEAVTAEEVRDFVLDALLVVNLGELAMALDDQGFLPEYRFWQLARGVLAAHRRRHPDLARGYDAFGVFAPAFHVEQLTARRLFPESERRFHEVANPLAGTGRRKGRGC